jgi:basic membrane lipoprotein Med (substrate-binding protein (PBP1-ABC) superfamily)
VADALTKLWKTSLRCYETVDFEVVKINNTTKRRNKMKKSTLACIALLLVAGCAQKPDAIAPAYVTPTLYESFSCKQLAAEEERLNQAYMTASGQQEQARKNDIAGVILLGLPVSSLSGGNVAPQIANLKGQKDAVRATMIKKSCSL